MRKLINFLIYQTGWLVCVLGAARGWPWAGVVFVLVALAWHLRQAEDPRAELRLAMIAALVGALWDTLLAATGIVQFTNGVLIEGTAAYWMVALWVLFGMTLNVSLAWLKQHLLGAAILGAVGGPLAYLAGARLGALSLPDNNLALPLLAIGWALITPLLCLIARRHDGYRASTPTKLEPSHV
ncbi:hypothetical protein AZ34_07555 [Hylemonella gracilis str. Niagara R]|uniref:DUF2878 domain-containing protein n=1 Tax=Hylemonella gracilis str. Niagara R TaxID=1458275 RepID=A0A016XGH3_9BURK|nr:DUF2878 domain-containing protein [Hylemonella gracilis]EYC50941.1 hypothetical protein AZ34_07555 [Hylemonella gracilis str. Niagara R]